VSSPRNIAAWGGAGADDVHAPVGRFREDGTELQHLVLDEEGNHLGQAHVLFLAVGEAGHFLALDQRLAIGRLDVAQRSGRMTHDGDGLAGGEEGLDQLDRVLVFGEVPHRAVAARIEQRVEVFLPDAVEADGLVELGLRRRIVLETHRQVGAELGLVALGVERRTAALGRGERDLRAGILEDVVGGCKLFEPEAGSASGVAELVVGGDDHQYFHDTDSLDCVC